ncbi:hypothetical protein LUZ63_013445 [Rhynchospora breviuscula]|uniref:glutathione transferase n=1 Tax=Rhynchospora breviuscula TaxID=2022672 RepID=A0A9Q0C8L2_9POAL|nr:hypothetical protein LUZ63_013445 [Rhynchospora breviuscula]
MVASEAVRLFGMWASPAVRRVEWALKLKGIEYEYIEEDLSNKSSSLLEFNPINKQVPVLLHNGNPIVESLVILEYIDETWKDNPILPVEPLERAKARFWATFVDVKCREESRKAFFMEGEEKEKAIENLQVQLKALDEELEGKKFFSGDHIGYTDLAVGWMAFWLGVAEETAGFKANYDVKFPNFSRWMKHFLAEPVIKDNLPPREKTVEFFRAFKQLGSCTKVNQK